MMAGDDDLAALCEQASLVSAAAISASDLDHAFHLQLSEAIEASRRAISLDVASSSSPQAAAPALLEPSSDAAYALALQADYLDRAEQDRRAAHAHALSAASVRVFDHDARFARELAAVPESDWARHGDYFERPLDPDPSSDGSLFRVFFKGMASHELVGPRDRDPGVAVLAAAVCGPQGEVVFRVQKPVKVFLAGGEVLEAMALVEGLHAALGLGIRNVNVDTDNILLRFHMLGLCRPKEQRLADTINQARLLQTKFKLCEISFVLQSEPNYVVDLARDALVVQIAKFNASKKKRETCTICLEDTDITKIHTVEVCAHRFCLSCMKEHVKTKLLNGLLPACPSDGCTTKLSVEGSKILLSPRLLDIMVQRIREGQVHPSQRFYCPYPKCSALMFLSEVRHPMQQSCSKYTVADAATLRKCVKCRGSFCISCRVPWHYRMTCYEYQKFYPYARPEDAKLQNLSMQRLWRQCVQCKHMIELAEGCYHITCVCGYEFCYICGKAWKDKKATCLCALWDERNIIRN